MRTTSGAGETDRTETEESARAPAVATATSRVTPATTLRRTLDPSTERPAATAARATRTRAPSARRRTTTTSSPRSATPGGALVGRWRWGGGAEGVGAEEGAEGEAVVRSETLRFDALTHSRSRNEGREGEGSVLDVVGGVCRVSRTSCRVSLGLRACLKVERVRSGAAEPSALSALSRFFPQSRALFRLLVLRPSFVVLLRLALVLVSLSPSLGSPPPCVAVGACLRARAFVPYRALSRARQRLRLLDRRRRGRQGEW